ELLPFDQGAHAVLPVLESAGFRIVGSVRHRLHPHQLARHMAKRLIWQHEYPAPGDFVPPGRRNFGHARLWTDHCQEECEKSFVPYPFCPSITSPRSGVSVALPTLMNERPSGRSTSTSSLRNESNVTRFNASCSIDDARASTTSHPCGAGSSDALHARYTAST